MIRVLFILLLSTPLWAGTLLPAQSIDTSFVPRGMDLSVNEMLAPAGTAAECMNWDLSVRHGSLVKRDGYRNYYSYTGYYPKSIFLFTNRDNEDRLIMCLKNADSNFQSIHVSAIAGANVSLTPSLKYWHRSANSYAATYKNTFIIANGKNRPYYYRGAEMLPLVEVPPGSFDFAPEPPSANTDYVLKGRYYYAWQAAMPDSVVGDSLYHHHADSLNLDGPSWQVQADSEWVRVITIPAISPTAVSAPDSTIIRLCRTRAGALQGDSMFYVMTIREVLTDSKTYLDSIPDESLGVAADYPFAGFVDTVSHRAVVGFAADDSLYKIGQPQYLSKDSLDNSSGISADDSLLGNVVFRRYEFLWYDSATGMLSAPGPFLRVPVDTNGSGYSLDSAIKIITPAFDTTKPYWGILARAEEMLGSNEIDTLDPATINNVTSYNDQFIIYTPSEPGRCRTGDGLRAFDGNCLAYRVILKNPQYNLDPYYPVCTLKVSQILKDDAGSYCDTVVDTFRSSSLREHSDPINPSVTIGNLSHVCIVDDRVLMSLGNKVYFNAFTSRGSEIAIWADENAFACGIDDADEITALHAGDGYVDIFKNKVWYRASEIGPNEYKISMVLRGIGCTAPYSIVDIPGGGIVFLGDDGIYDFSSHWQSQYKTSGGNINKISNPVWSKMGAMGRAALRQCYAWKTIDGNNVVFSFPTVDTSYVYSLTTGQWGEWDISMRMSALYASHSVEVYQGDSDVVFIKDDSQKVYRWGGTKHDLSDSVQGTWKSLPMYQTGDYGKITGFGLWKYSNDTLPITFTTYDADSDSSRAVVDSTQNRYRWHAINPKISQGFQIEIKSKADSLTIDRIDLRYQPQSRRPEY